MKKLPFQMVTMTYLPSNLWDSSHSSDSSDSSESSDRSDSSYSKGESSPIYTEPFVRYFY